ncbi:hypothetical protein J7296_03332 [Nakaseomyces glabratus]|nr:hypothetical protein J7296_03332 [Nakaseomyces glabratus]KAI8395643.1 hypothetical protein J6895_03364 [Nakaseomyces glabratus]
MTRKLQYDFIRCLKHWPFSILETLRDKALSWIYARYSCNNDYLQIYKKS